MKRNVNPSMRVTIQDINFFRHHFEYASTFVREATNFSETRNDIKCECCHKKRKLYKYSSWWYCKACSSYLDAFADGRKKQAIQDYRLIKNLVPKLQDKK